MSWKSPAACLIWPATTTLQPLMTTLLACLPRAVKPAPAKPTAPVRWWIMTQTTMVYAMPTKSLDARTTRPATTTAPRPIRRLASTLMVFVRRAPVKLTAQELPWTTMPMTTVCVTPMRWWGVKTPRPATTWRQRPIQVLVNMPQVANTAQVRATVQDKCLTVTPTTTAYAMTMKSQAAKTALRATTTLQQLTTTVRVNTAHADHSRAYPPTP